MNTAGYLVASIGLGVCATVILLGNRHRAGLPLTGWSRVLAVVAGLLAGFQMVTAIGHLLFGQHSLPLWTDLTGHLWMPVLGLIYGLSLSPGQARQDNPTLRQLGYAFLVIGTLVVAADLYELLARN